MGWTWGHRDDGLSVKDYLAREYRNDQWRIIDAAIVKRTEYYAAAEYVRDGVAPKGTIVALVFILGYSRSHMNFGYKDMDETVGPTIDHCPRRILDLLTPTNHKHALDWRARCRANLAKPKVKAGQVVQFVEPIKFENGASLSSFRYVRGSQFQSDTFPGLYRITGWKDRQYTVQA